MNRLFALILALALLLSTCYTYYRGLQDGEQQYKQSRRMYFALKSAYHFGYLDAKQGRPEDWDGEDL